MNKQLINQIVLLTLLAVFGYYIGRRIGTDQEKKDNALKGALAGVALGLVISILFTTVNYCLKHKGEVVYHGLTYERRFQHRINEHRTSGKVFDEISCDLPKPRNMARWLEKMQVKSDMPRYNIQHNS